MGYHLTMEGCEVVDLQRILLGRNIGLPKSGMLVVIKSKISSVFGAFQQRTMTTLEKGARALRFELRLPDQTIFTAWHSFILDIAVDLYGKMVLNYEREEVGMRGRERGFQRGPARRQN